MNHTARHSTPRIFWSVTFAAAVVVAALVAVPQWLARQARLDALRSHVAQIAQLAGSVVDGDLHYQLLDSAGYTPELYAKTLAPLVRFHSANSQLLRVRTMAERDGKSFFVVDTAASSELVKSHTLRASAYMEPHAIPEEKSDADWLQRIASGQTHVSARFRHDQYSDFLSAHAPIFDSQKRYSGFVGIDFDVEDFMAREARFNAILIGTTAAALLLTLSIGYFAVRYRVEKT